MSIKPLYPKRLLAYWKIKFLLKIVLNYFFKVNSSIILLKKKKPILNFCEIIVKHCHISVVVQAKNGIFTVVAA